MCYVTAQLCAANVRELPIALAHYAVRRKPGEPGALIANKLFARLTPADQLRCRWELHECREARRGQRNAEIVHDSAERER